MYVDVLYTVGEACSEVAKERGGARGSRQGVERLQSSAKTWAGLIRYFPTEFSKMGMLCVAVCMVLDELQGIAREGLAQR